MTGRELKARRVALGWPAPLVALLSGYSAAAIYGVEGERGGGERLRARLAETYDRGNDAERWASHHGYWAWLKWHHKEQRKGRRK
jgi:hypothetical protein